MSRYYEMTVYIKGFVPKRADAIIEAAQQEWDFDREDFDRFAVGTTNKTLYCTGRSSLCGGESEKEFTLRLAKEIWRANGGYCGVTVKATFLEELPYEEYSPGKDEYDAWLKESRE